MNKSRLQELAGIQLNEGSKIKVTKENPLVYIWKSAESTDYPSQGLSGHMHLNAAAYMHDFSPAGLAEKLWKLDKNERIKAGKVWLSMSQWTELSIERDAKDPNKREDVVKEGEDLYLELMGQFKNLKSFMPENEEQLKKEFTKNADAYIGICKDIISAVSKLKGQ